MVGRASFSGNLTLGLVVIGVKAYAVSADNDIGLNWLHRECLSQVSQAWKCKACGLLVEKPVKGFHAETGWVVIEPTDLASMGLEEDASIPILTFISRSVVSPLLFDRQYYLMPYSPEASRPYYLLARALSQEKLEAVVSYISRGKSHLGVVSPVGNDLALRSVCYYDEIRELSDYGIKRPPAPEFTQRELKLARDLVKRMSGEFEHSQYPNISKTRLLELIEAKAAGRPIRPIPVSVEAPKVLDLSIALETSLKNLNSRKRRAPGRKPQQQKRVAR